MAPTKENFYCTGTNPRALKNKTNKDEPHEFFNAIVLCLILIPPNSISFLSQTALGTENIANMKN